MDNPVRKFIPRAPRYVLRPNDKHMVRYSSEYDHRPVIQRTRLLNLSETGMAIEMDLSECPQVGERLKVELPVPAGEQIAWWARVVRTHIRRKQWWTTNAEMEPEKVVVALHFEGLPQGHIKTIRKGLNERFLEEMRERRQAQLLYLRALWIKNTWKILGWTLTAFVVAGIIYWLSRPSANYDPEKGTGWGERFQFFDFEKRK